MHVQPQIKTFAIFVKKAKFLVAMAAAAALLAWVPRFARYACIMGWLHPVWTVLLRRRHIRQLCAAPRYAITLSQIVSCVACAALGVSYS